MGTLEVMAGGGALLGGLIGTFWDGQMSLKILGKRGRHILEFQVWRAQGVLG